jgi:predicted phage terminase large subunit-like protein
MPAYQVFNFYLQPTQEKAFYCDADFIIFGGAAGGGKSYWLEVTPLPYLNYPGFNCVIFRRESPEITNPGGLWDLSFELYSPLGLKPKVKDLCWEFGKISKIKFSHMQRVSDKYKHKGAQYVIVCFDEVDSFEFSQVWYLLSRMRSTSGVKPRMRATCNPNADSWVAKFIEWYIDQDTGYAINERSGVVRWFLQRGEGVEGIEWFDSKEAALDKYPRSSPKSFTFIASKLEDNQALLDKDPDYESNLEALGKVERERLKYGNWKIRPAAGLYFQRENLPIIDENEVPDGLTWIRYWDLASTKEKQKKAESGQPCYTAGGLVAIDWEDRATNKIRMIYIKHVSRFRKAPADVEKKIESLAEADGINTYIGIEEDPGAAGVIVSHHFANLLQDYALLTPKKTDNKIAAASPLSAQAEKGKVCLVRGKWNEAFIDEAENFPDGKFKDQVDAVAGAFNTLKTIPDVWVA